APHKFVAGTNLVAEDCSSDVKDIAVCCLGAVTVVIGERRRSSQTVSRDANKLLVIDSYGNHAFQPGDMGSILPLVSIKGPIGTGSKIRIIGIHHLIRRVADRVASGGGVVPVKPMLGGSEIVIP